MEIRLLTYTWSVSKGRDTYGYNICSLLDTKTNRRYRCNGGGYDMQGTAFAQWLQDIYQDRLHALPMQDHGMYRDDKRTSLDGGFGLRTMIMIAEKMGLTVQEHYKDGRELVGITVFERG